MNANLTKYSHSDKTGLSFGTQQTINASINTVWDTLTNVNAYPEWNPFTPIVKTSFEIGSPIKFKVRLLRSLPNQHISQMETVSDFTPHSLMGWRSQQGDGSRFRTHRCFHLSAIDDSRTLVENSMRYEGSLWRLFALISKHSVLNGFEDISQALATRCANA
ncbi:MAG: SRPBCC domain-containing protein [Pseudomonadota bacterium]